MHSAWQHTVGLSILGDMKTRFGAAIHVKCCVKVALFVFPIVNVVDIAQRIVLDIRHVAPL